VRIADYTLGSGDTVVTMVQPAESLMTENTAGGQGRSSPIRRSLPECHVRPVFVVVAHIFSEQSLQMLLVHRDDVIQQVPPTAFDPALRDAILPGTLERGPHRPHVEGSYRCGNLKPVLPVPVKDQESGSRPRRKGFPQLLNRPQAGRVLGHVEMQNLPAVVGNHEKAVEQAERDGRNREEVHGGDCLPMVAEKREPTLGRLMILGRSLHPARDVRSEMSKPSMRSSP
jgi:hypothetical protein